jgi:hypothetical protein
MLFQEPARSRIASAISLRPTLEISTAMCFSVHLVQQICSESIYRLQRHMPHFDEYLAGDEQVKKRIAFNNLQGSHIAAGWLYRRFQLFKKKVLQLLLNTEDEWYRWEWQNRGSWSCPWPLVGFGCSGSDTRVSGDFREFLVPEYHRL